MATLFCLRVTCHDCGKVIGHIDDVSVEGVWDDKRITAANTISTVRDALRDHVRLSHVKKEK